MTAVRFNVACASKPMICWLPPTAKPLVVGMSFPRTPCAVCKARKSRPTSNRVETSISKWNLNAQTDALKAAGVERIFSNNISGSMRKRPELDKLLDQLRPGDVIVVTKYDRLGRSLRDQLDIVGTIKDHGAGFRSLAEDIDTTTPAGRLIFHVFASIAQFERERISERTREGLLASGEGARTCQGSPERS